MAALPPRLARDGRVYRESGEALAVPPLGMSTTRFFPLQIVLGPGASIKRWVTIDGSDGVHPERLRYADGPETLIERAAAFGYPALALLDADGVYGAPRFHMAAKKAGIRAHIGAEVTVQNPFQVSSFKFQFPVQSGRSGA